MDDSTRPRRRIAAAAKTPAKARADAPLPTTSVELTMALLKSGATPELITATLAHRDREAAEKRQQAYRVAFLAFQGQGVEIIKTSSYQNAEGEEIWYTPLAQLIEGLLPALNAAGLSHRFIPNQLSNGDISITCRLTHVDGHFEEATLSGPPNESPDLTKAQANVATSTLLQRATLKALCGVAEKHDDLDGRRTSVDGSGSSTPSSIEQEPPRREKSLAEPKNTAQPSEPMATLGERQNILVRARMNGRDVAGLLANALGDGAAHIPVGTLEGLTKEQFKLVRAEL